MVNSRAQHDGLCQTLVLVERVGGEWWVVDDVHRTLRSDAGREHQRLLRELGEEVRGRAFGSMESERADEGCGRDQGRRCSQWIGLGWKGGRGEGEGSRL